MSAAHSQNITPHGGNVNLPQNVQIQQPTQAPSTAPNTSNLSSTLGSTSTAPNTSNLSSTTSSYLPPVSGTHQLSNTLGSTLEQQYNPPSPRPTYPHTYAQQGANMQPQLQPQMTHMQQVQLRPQEPSQVLVSHNLLLTVPQIPVAPGEQPRAQILQGYLPNQQPMTIIMQTVPVSTQQSFAFTLPDQKSLPGSGEWMSNTQIPLEEIPILGSNNSGFFMGEHRAQRSNIAQQLKFGVRFLDFAIVQYHDEIYLDQYKHIYDLCCPYISISEALWSIRFFIERNKNEIVFLNLRSNSTKKAGENSDPIDPILLEAKFRIIEKFIFQINEIKFSISSKELTESTKKNIICFTEDNELFDFLSKKKSLSSSQFEVVPLLNYDIQDELKKSWLKTKQSNISADPKNMRFIWFILDAITPTHDAELLSSTWYEQLRNHILPPFHFFSLCKVNKHTWKMFNSLMLYKQERLYSS